jgi:ribonuclease VapC
VTVPPLVIDSSALVALLMAEREAPAVFEALVAAPACSVGAPTLVETAMVLAGRRGVAPEAADADLARLLARFGIAVLPFGPDHWPAAWAAFLRYGKGRHPAGLNFGDCLTYAVARLAGSPLLCVGGDFELTDLELVAL